MILHSPKFPRLPVNVLESLNVASSVPTRGIPLAEWARARGVAYQTAWKWARRGLLPQGAQVEHMPSGMIIVHEPMAAHQAAATQNTYVYARINPKEAREELEEQAKACVNFCNAQGWSVTQLTKEMAPGVGDKRPKLRALLSKPPGRLVIASKSRLSRFEFGFYEVLLAALGWTLVVLDQTTETQGACGALEDLTDAISITCRLHYGQKRGTLLVDMLKKAAQSQHHFVS